MVVQKVTIHLSGKLNLTNLSLAPGSTCHFAGEKMGTDNLLRSLGVGSVMEIKYQQRRVLPENSLEVYQTGRNFMVKDSGHSI